MLTWPIRCRIHQPAAKLFLALSVCSVTTSSSYAAGTDPSVQPSAHSHRAAVLNSFQRWSSGAGHPSELLEPEAEWILMGSSCLSRTYHGLKDTTDNLGNPLHVRLSGHIVPQVQDIFEDGDTVIVRFSAKAIALDGKPYQNDYVWFMSFRNNKVVKLVAYLDTRQIEDLISRVAPAAGTTPEKFPASCSFSPRSL